MVFAAADKPLTTKEDEETRQGQLGNCEGADQLSYLTEMFRQALQSASEPSTDGGQGRSDFDNITGSSSSRPDNAENGRLLLLRWLESQDQSRAEISQKKSFEI